jgi:hypothetical protein
MDCLSPKESLLAGLGAAPEAAEAHHGRHLRVHPHHVLELRAVAAVQVEFGSKPLKPVFHIIGSRVVETRRFKRERERERERERGRERNYGSNRFNLYSPTEPPPPPPPPAPPPPPPPLPLPSPPSFFASFFAFLRSARCRRTSSSSSSAIAAREGAHTPGCQIGYMDCNMVTWTDWLHGLQIGYMDRRLSSVGALTVQNNAVRKVPSLPRAC